MNTFWKLFKNILLYDQKATIPQLKRLYWFKNKTTPQKTRKPKTCGLDEAKPARIPSLSQPNWKTNSKHKPEKLSKRKTDKGTDVKTQRWTGTWAEAIWKGYTKKPSKPRILRTALVHYVRLGRNVKARDIRKPVIFLSNIFTQPDTNIFKPSSE